MPFELSNIQASLQGYINQILTKKLDIFVIIYLDDIFIYTKDQDQGRMGALRYVLNLLRKNGLFANLKICWFKKNKVCFLGYVVLAPRMRMEDKWIKMVKNWPEPTSVRNIQMFIDFANFY